MFITHTLICSWAMIFLMTVGSMAQRNKLYQALYALLHNRKDPRPNSTFKPHNWSVHRSSYIQSMETCDINNILKAIFVHIEFNIFSCTLLRMFCAAVCSLTVSFLCVVFFLVLFICCFCLWAVYRVTGCLFQDCVGHHHKEEYFRASGGAQAAHGAPGD